MRDYDHITVAAISAFCGYVPQGYFPAYLPCAPPQVPWRLGGIFTIHDVPENKEELPDLKCEQCREALQRRLIEAREK